MPGVKNKVGYTCKQEREGEMAARHKPENDVRSMATETWKPRDGAS